MFGQMAVVLELLVYSSRDKSDKGLQGQWETFMLYGGGIVMVQPCRSSAIEGPFHKSRGAARQAATPTVMRIIIQGMWGRSIH